jgi:hypothetical protein
MFHVKHPRFDFRIVSRETILKGSSSDPGDIHILIFPPGTRPSDKEIFFSPHVFAINHRHTARTHPIAAQNLLKIAPALISGLSHDDFVQY